MTRLPIIAFKGKGGSGKSTAAKMLVDQGYVKTSFAEPMRRMLEAIGVECDAMTDTERKEAPLGVLSGKSPRVALQMLGTEWGRALDPNFWVNLWGIKAAGILALGQNVVLDDCRFPNEAEAIRKLGGFVIEVVCNEDEVATVGIAGHASETQDFEPDITVVNGKQSLAMLRADLTEALDVLRSEAVDDRLAA